MSVASMGCSGFGSLETRAITVEHDTVQTRCPTHRHRVHDDPWEAGIANEIGKAHKRQIIHETICAGLLERCWNGGPFPALEVTS
jgi:hypothetical protein